MYETVESIRSTLYSCGKWFISKPLFYFQGNSMPTLAFSVYDASSKPIHQKTGTSLETQVLSESRMTPFRSTSSDGTSVEQRTVADISQRKKEDLTNLSDLINVNVEVRRTIFN